MSHKAGPRRLDSDTVTPAKPALTTLSFNSLSVPNVQIPVAIIGERSTGSKAVQRVSNLLRMSPFLNALYPEWRSRCPGWPGICWCWHLPSALCLRWMQRQPSRCPPGPPGGSYLTSYEAALRQTTPVTFSNVSEEEHSLGQNRQQAHGDGRITLWSFPQGRNVHQRWINAWAWTVHAHLGDADGEDGMRAAAREIHGRAACGAPGITKRHDILHVVVVVNQAFRQICAQSSARRI